MEFVHEGYRNKLGAGYSHELNDFLLYAKQNIDTEPGLLRAAFARIKQALNAIRKNECKKDVVNLLMGSIYSFIEGGATRDKVNQWIRKMITADKNAQEELVRIVYDYNNLANKLRSSGFSGIYNIKDWWFSIDGIEPAK